MHVSQKVLRFWVEQGMNWLYNVFFCFCVWTKFLVWVHGTLLSRVVIEFLIANCKLDNDNHFLKISLFEKELFFCCNLSRNKHGDLKFSPNTWLVKWQFLKCNYQITLTLFELVIHFKCQNFSKFSFF